MYVAETRRENSMPTARTIACLVFLEVIQLRASCRRQGSRLPSPEAIFPVTSLACHRRPVIGHGLWAVGSGELPRFSVSAVGVE